MRKQVEEVGKWGGIIYIQSRGEMRKALFLGAWNKNRYHSKRKTRRKKHSGWQKSKRGKSYTRGNSDKVEKRKVGCV